MKETTEDLKALIETTTEFARLEAKDYTMSHMDEARRDKDKFFEKMAKELPGMPGKDRFISVFAENMTNKVQAIRKESFHDKLNEKYAFLKYALEYMSKRYRYHAFSIGLISLFTSLLLTLTSR